MGNQSACRILRPAARAKGWDRVLMHAVFNDLAGIWQIDRQIKPGGRFTGLGHFQREKDDVYLYEERGALVLESGEVLEDVRRAYKYVLNDCEEIEIYFADGANAGALFQTLRGDARAVILSDHDCPPDNYESAYDFSALPDSFSTEHKVRGPRKAYVSVSKFSR